MPDVIHKPEWHRFVIDLENGDQGRLDYRRLGDSIVFVHTEVPPDHEGQGIGGRLAVAGLNYAREKSLIVVPRCPFIADYLKKHSEFGDLVDPEYR